MYFYFDNSGITEPDLNTLGITFTRGFDFSKYQIIYSNGIRPDAFVWWHRVKIKPRCKIVTTIHSFAIPDLTAIFNPIIGKLFGTLWQIFWRYPDMLITLSEQAKQHYQKVLPKQKIEVVNNGIAPFSFEELEIDTKDIDFLTSLKENHEIIMLIGRLDNTKGIEQVFVLLQQNPQLCAVVIGKGRLFDKLQREAHAKKVSQRFILLGTRKSAKYYLQFAGYFICPAHSEGFGLVVTEAMCAKVPIMLSNLPVFEELYPANTVQYFELNDDNSINNTFIELKTKKQTLVEEAYSHF